MKMVSVISLGIGSRTAAEECKTDEHSREQSDKKTPNLKMKTKITIIKTKIKTNVQTKQITFRKTKFQKQKLIYK